MRSSVKDIKAEFDRANNEELTSLLEEYASDERSGVSSIIKSALKRRNNAIIEEKRLSNMKALENELYQHGYRYIAATDEVGRGPLCGPVVSACVIMPEKSCICGINDSKKLTAIKREELEKQIRLEAIAVGIGIVDNKVIDEINILNATKLSMKQAYESLSQQADILLLDAMKIDANVEQKSFIKGDATVYSIAAASIVAKVTRDSMMDEYDVLYPEYDLKNNKGYGTQKHIDAIREHGPSPIHRKSFITGIIGNTHRREGQVNEERAEKYLQAHGMITLKKNYTVSGGEIDLVMLEDNTVVFVEVKSTGSGARIDPAERIDENKRRRISDCAYRFIFEHPEYKNRSVRYDAVIIETLNDGCYRLKHMKNII